MEWYFLFSQGFKRGGVGEWNELVLGGRIVGGEGFGIFGDFVTEVGSFRKQSRVGLGVGDVR